MHGDVLLSGLTAAESGFNADLAMLRSIVLIWGPIPP